MLLSLLSFELQIEQVIHCRLLLREERGVLYLTIIQTLLRLINLLVRLLLLYLLID